MDKTDTLSRDAQSILERAARSMFELFANASEGMLLVDRQARVVWVNDQYKRYLPALGFDNPGGLWGLENATLPSAVINSGVSAASSKFAD